ncbi:Uncharacterized protein, DUF1919 family [Pseudobutyrivibrio sp. ACV-2]|nr:Uncharacterized protein, DUF1919 family [Pseudobutyrivibrio sp. ACV-2]
MYKCLLWGMGKILIENINLIKYFETKGDIKVIAITGNEDAVTFYGYKYINKMDINAEDYDLVIIMAKSVTEIKNEAIKVGFPERKIIFYPVLRYPDLKFDDLKKLINNVPSIFSMNCWGGIVYHRLGLEFKSPFINMFLEEGDYIKFLGEPKHYIETNLEVIEYLYNKDLDINYPVCLCDDIKLFFNHYSSYEQALFCWNKRKKRIEWNNLFVTMYTNNEDIIRKFYELPYKKKVCFTSLNTEKNDSIYLKRKADEEYYKTVSSVAWGKNPEIDIIQLLLHGSKSVILR